MRERAYALAPSGGLPSVSHILAWMITKGRLPMRAQSPQLTLIAGGSCGRDDCPSVFTIDRGTLAGESVVEIPVEVLREAARALGW